jgi:1-acyl-sn-glycerol-3-phosphate acyltransferase
MIEARKHAVFDALFAWHARARIAGSFTALRVRGAVEAQAAAAAAPLLVVSNHTAWWDALVALVLTRWAFAADGYALMDQENLRRLPFFGKVGAFGVNLADPRDGARALRYARGLLDRPGRLVWIFPQGRERPITERPLAFRPGSAAVARLARGARVIPVGIRYELGAEERASIWVSIGAARDPAAGQEAELELQRAGVEAELDGIDAALRAGDAVGFPALVAGRSQRLSALSTWALARLTGGPAPGASPPAGRAAAPRARPRRG